VEDSILKSTKKMLGVDESYTVFDLEIATHINAALSEVNQIGVGDGMPISDGGDDKWSEKFAGVPVLRLNMVKTIVFLKTKLAFDPPGTSYLIDNIKDQIDQQMWRLNAFAESDRILPEPEEVEPV